MTQIDHYESDLRVQILYLSRLDLSLTLSFHTTPQTAPSGCGSMVAAPPRQRDLAGSHGDLKQSL